MGNDKFILYFKMDMNLDGKCLKSQDSLVEVADYCPSYGLRTKLGRLTIKELMSEFLSSLFNMEAPFPKTLSGMFFQPHLKFKAFIQGRRKSFYAVVKYMVLCLFINILIGELVGFDPLENQRLMDSDPMDEKSIVGYKAGTFLSHYLNYFLFILPFSMAALSSLLFWRSSYNFAERTAMGFYLSGQFIILSLISILLSKVDPVLFNLMLPVSILYFTFYKSLGKNSPFSRIILSFFTALFSFFGYIVTAYFIAIFIVLQFNL